MKWSRPWPGVITVALFFAALAMPADASSIALDVNGVLGPVLGGSDRLGLTGLYFTLTGVMDQDAAPISTTADSATYSVPGTLQIALGNLMLTGYGATLTLTDAPSGPDLVTIAFDVTEFNFNPDVWATLSLPPDTLQGTGIQDFTASVSQPDSSFSYFIPGVSDEILATLGVTGTVSMSGGTPPSGVPEPGTISLLAAGLAAVASKIGRFRKPR